MYNFSYFLYSRKVIEIVRQILVFNRSLQLNLWAHDLEAYNLQVFSLEQNWWF